LEGYDRDRLFPGTGSAEGLETLPSSRLPSDRLSLIVINWDRNGEGEGVDERVEGGGSEGTVLGVVAVVVKVVKVVVLEVEALLPVVVLVVEEGVDREVVAVLEVLEGGIVGEKEVVVSAASGRGFWTTTAPEDGRLWILFHQGTLVVVCSAVEAVVLTVRVVVDVLVVAVVVLKLVVVVLVVVVVVAGDVIGSGLPLSVSPDDTWLFHHFL
jgi:hypothetical protein